MKSELERILLEYPKLNYDNGNIYKSKRHSTPLYDEEQSNAIVAEYFDDSQITVAGEDNNPENETFQEVNGHVFIEVIYGGSYELAFKEAVNSLKK